MKNGKNGFTLVEMLVCIAIIAALGVTIGLNATKVLNDTQNNDYEEIFGDLFDAAKIFVELSSSEPYCGTMSTSQYGTCNVTLEYLVQKGLVDKEIYKQNNPMRKNKKFQADDGIVITKTNGKKSASYSVSECTNDVSGCSGINYVNDSNIKDYKCWGGCN